MPRRGFALKLTDRFWSKVDQTGDCWLWQAYTSKTGYGQFRLGKTMVKAHRMAYELTNGSLEPDAVLRHSCDTPACVRPDHLMPGTQADNIQDMDDRGRRRSRNGSQTECHKGHPFSPENTYLNPQGSRECRPCRRERKRARKGVSH